MGSSLRRPWRPSARNVEPASPVTIWLCGVVLAVLLLAPCAARAEPYVPADDAEVLERLGGTSSPQLQQLRRRRAAFGQEEPDNLDRALALSTAYVELGRREADPRYDGYAQAALAPWWSLAEPPVPVLVLRATLRQRRHDFDGALADLDQVLTRSPANPQAWLTKATVEAVQGRPEDAFTSCAHLAGRVAPLIAAACSGVAARLNDRAAGEYRRLRQAFDEAPAAEPRLRLWVLTILAELAAQLGQDAEAEEHFRIALALNLRDPYLIGAYADFLLDRDRAAEVLALLDGEIRTDPLLLRLALAERRLNRPTLDEHVGMLGDRFEAERRRGDIVHRRERARFTLHLLDRPREALGLALANWAVQREPWDARLVLEAALAAGEPNAALPVTAWLAQTNLHDVRIEALAREVAGTKP